MEQIKKALKKRIDKKAKKKTESKKSEPKQQKPPEKNYPDVQKLVHLLQVHQIELEHQNEELRLAQAELEVSRNKYVNLFDFSPTPYITLNLNGMIKEVNLSTSKMLGIDRNKLIGKHFNTFISIGERDVFNAFIKTIFDSDEKQSCELSIVNKEKRLFNILLEGLELEEAIESEKKCQLALIDLTEYKTIEHSLKVSNEELKTLNNTKDKFFSIIAHDLRSPFQSLLSYSEMLATEIETLSPEEIISFSKELNDILNNLYGLLNNLLHWSMMQRNLIEYNPINLNLYDKVDKIIGISIHSALKKHVSVSNRVEPETLVYADADMVRSVIQNLIINAIKYTQPEGRIIVSAVEKGDCIEVSVQDTGIGIEAGKSSELFDFNKIFTTTGTEGEKGTGLGLPLCKEFVERNNGKIWVESELGKGSKFIFTLSKAIS